MGKDTSYKLLKCILQGWLLGSKGPGTLFAKSMTEPLRADVNKVKIAYIKTSVPDWQQENKKKNLKHIHTMDLIINLELK